jgi:hypothetical protein
MVVLIIFVAIILYLFSIIGAREELVLTGQKVNKSDALQIYFPFWNTLMSITYLIETLASNTQNGINSEIETNQKRNFRKDLKAYKHNDDKQNNHC